MCLPLAGGQWNRNSKNSFLCVSRLREISPSIDGSLWSPNEARNGRKHLRLLDWLRHVFMITRGERTFTVLARGIAGQRNGRSHTALINRPLAHLADQFVTIFIRHADVADQNI